MSDAEKPAKPTVAMPKTLGACADLYFATRERRLAAEKVAAAIKADENAIQEHLIRLMPNEETSQVAGKTAYVKRQVKKIAQVKDWDAFGKYVLKTKRLDLLQRRVSDTAIKDVVDAAKGKVPPGIEFFTVVSLSTGKV